MSTAPDWPEVVRALIRANKELTAALERTLDRLPAAPDAPAVHPEELTDYQLEILEALEGKALKVRTLGAALGDVSRLYRPGGLKELRAAGLVQMHAEYGLYRPDAPPPGLKV